MNKRNVILHFARNNIFEWQKKSPRVEAILLKRPAGPGDTFKFEIPNISPGVSRIVELSGSTPDFIGFDYED